MYQFNHTSILMKTINYNTLINCFFPKLTVEIIQKAKKIHLKISKKGIIVVTVFFKSVNTDESFTTDITISCLVVGLSNHFGT